MSFLYRFELDYLSTWYHRTDRKPLVIRGARQVGKSTLVRLLATKENLKLIELDFEKNPDFADLFKSQDPKTIFSLLGVQLNENISVASTLLFLDEIQKTPQILATLRYFYEQMPGLAVIAAGSLLDLTLKNINFSIPVGRIEYLYLTPMTFEAFLIAINKKNLCNFLQEYELDQKIPISIHQLLLDALKKYLIVGGLPEAVAKYVTTENFIDVERVKKSLLIGYQEDFSKYATLAEQNRMRLIFNKIPRILGEKFKYSHIDSEQKSTVLKSGLDHLNLARIIHIVYHTDANGLPLAAEMNEKNFKTFFLDVGLVASALGTNILDFKDPKDISLVNSGKIAEQFVAQELIQFREYYEQPSLYYWMREKKSASAEIDFVISHRGKIIPVEVKSGSGGSLKSLHYFLKEKKLQFAVKFSTQLPNLLQTKIQLSSELNSFVLLSLPFYLIGQLRRFCK